MQQPFEKILTVEPISSSKNHVLDPAEVNSKQKELFDLGYYFYAEEEALRTHSFVVLNEQGLVIGAGRKPGEADHSFLVPKTGINRSADNSTHAYIVIKGQRQNPYGEMENIQIVAMRGFNGSDSSHLSLFNYLTSKLSKFSEILAQYKISIEKDYYFSGECHSDLNIGKIQEMLGNYLAEITFNTKGTMTERFKKPESPPVITYIPESCMSTHEQHKEHDKYLKLHGPHYREKLEKNNRSTSLASSSSLGFFSPQVTSYEGAQPKQLDTDLSSTI